MTPQPPAATLDAALREARARGVERGDALALLGQVLGRSRSWLLAHGDEPLDTAARARFDDGVDRLLADEPLGYVTGLQPFHGIELAVAAGMVLLPRPDTEALVEWALEALRVRAQAGHVTRVLDLGTGSGAIVLALAAAAREERIAAAFTATDLSPDALAVARENGLRLGLDVAWHHGRWWQALPNPGARFDIVLSNPPYLADDDPHLPALAAEPRMALTAGPDGLDDLRAIVAGAPAWLAPAGMLRVEHAHDQGPDVRTLIEAAGLTFEGPRHDLAGRWRCSGGRLAIDAAAPTLG